MIVYVTFPLRESDITLLDKGLLPSESLLLAQHLPENERKRAFLQAQVAFGNVPLEWVEESVRLQWLQLYSTGLNPYQQIDWNNKPFPVTVTNLHGFFGEPVAETALAGILALYRKLDQLFSLQAQKQWIGQGIRPHMQVLHHKSVLILGAGAIGSTLAKLLTAFSCQLQVVSRSTYPTLADLDVLLPAADIVVNCLPDTAQTRGILNADRIRRMKPSALIVNVGRGTAIDEPALMKALQGGKLAGAVLDVSEREPLASDHPLWRCPNVLLTQHTGGGYQAEDTDKIRVFLKNLHHYRHGEPLEHVVNFSKGY
jgi:phosphoglycerate dehydrogenase-like enzyme